MGSLPSRVVRTKVRSLLAEPPAPDPPPVRWLDHVLVVLTVVAAVLGAIFEPDIAWRPMAMVVGVAIAPTLWLRRQRPLLALLVGFGLQAALDIATVAASAGPTLLGSTGFVAVMLLYAVGRWASGRDVATSLGIIVVTNLATELAATDPSVGEYFGALPFTLLPVAVGRVVNYRVRARRQGVAEAKTNERQLIARELHDTVAHHVSAIAIQAQAGRALARTNPDAAVEVLGVIEDAASRALADMRRMVGVLRDTEPAALAPHAGLAEIRRLVDAGGAGPPASLTLEGDLDDLESSVEAGLYRLTQESLTNARRHARHASRVDVTITGTPDEVLLEVRDDGDALVADDTAGFGLVGMAERASLLGGTLTAGPGPDRGWVVHAALPRVQRGVPT